MAELVKRFKYKETLGTNSLMKTITLLGTIDDKDAIVTLQKLQFTEDEDFFKDLGVDDIRNLDCNDVYSWNVATVIQDINSRPGAKINVIYPATETHIKKYRTQKRKVIVETPEMYKRAVVPYIEKMKGDRIKWVYNILHEGKEADRVVFRSDDPDHGFVMLPDMKWDRKSMESLYLVAIVVRHDLSSIRDLRKEHIPALQKIKQIIQDVVPQKYDISADELKIYFHYQPSYYHLHIHVANIAHEQMDFGKSILLDNVIDQLNHLGPNGMEEATLTYFIGENHELYGQFQQA